jgi:molybdate transport system substrate-binding protein
MPIQSANSKNQIEVACAGAMRELITELADAFMLTSGSEISLKFDRSGAVKTRVLDGEIVDVVITTKVAIDELARRHRVAPDSTAVVAHSKIGVAIRSGTPKPNIESVELFKRALLDAKSLACADPATGSPSGNHFVALLHRLGIAEEIEPKLKRIGSTHGSVVVVCEAVARGEAEIGIQQIAEILPVSGVELAGPLPGELQQVTAFSAAAASSARKPELARRFIAFISSAVAAPVIMVHGMEPPLGQA